jgi:ribose 5-phosphate isomerase A
LILSNLIERDQMTDLDIYKQQAAERALELIQSGMALGLGTGSTADYILRGLAERLRDGRLRDVVGVPTSERTAALARELGVPLVTLEQRPLLDLALDGADEIDPALQLIKGLGGALLREKIVAAAAQRLVIVGDDSKLVTQLGTHALLPVEVILFGLPLCVRRLTEIGSTPTLRRAADGTPFRTDEGNVILDCRFPSIADPAALNAAINAIPGVVGHGLFIGMVSMAIVVGTRGVIIMTKPT